MLSQKGSDILKNHYRTADIWRVRERTHAKYTEPKVDFVAWVLEHVDWNGNEAVLDAGCGPGRYYHYFQENLPDVRYTGLDYSTGMMADHPAPNRLIRGALDAIPLPDNSFDVIMANHVLYLAPDIETAVQEMQRLLKPNGVFVTATNSLTTMPQFRELFRRAILLVSPPGVSREVKAPAGLHQRFALENGSVILSRHYRAVVRHDLPTAFVFDEVDPIMDYLESSRATHEPQLPENISWDQMMLIMREQLNNLIDTLETLTVDKLTGVLIATNSGGFIEEFMQMRTQHSGEES